MTIDNLTFFGEEVILRAEKIEKKLSAFEESGMTHEKDSYERFKVIKVGQKQYELKEGDYVLVNKNGLPSEIHIAGVGKIKDTYSLPTSQRIFCKIND